MWKIGNEQTAKVWERLKKYKWLFFFDYCSIMSILPWHSDQGKQWSLKWRKTASTKRAEVSVACFRSVELGVVLGVSNCIATVNNRKYSFVNSENTFRLYFNGNQRTSLLKKTKTEFPRTAQSSLGRCETRSSTYRAPLYRHNTFGDFVSFWWFNQ